jgi:hypothetical protein
MGDTLDWVFKLATGLIYVALLLSALVMVWLVIVKIWRD